MDLAGDHGDDAANEGRRDGGDEKADKRTDHNFILAPAACGGRNGFVRAFGTGRPFLPCKRLSKHMTALRIKRNWVRLFLLLFEDGF